MVCGVEQKIVDRDAVRQELWANPEFCLILREELAWKQSNPCYAEKHIIVATYPSHIFTLSMDTDGTLLCTIPLPLLLTLIADLCAC